MKSKAFTRIICILLALLLALFLAYSAACVDNAPPDPPPPSDPPELPDDPKGELTIGGVDDVGITRGEFFNAYSGVTATSAYGEDVSGKIIVSGAVNTSRVGNYTLTYSITDGGETVTKNRVVTVTENPHINDIKPIPIYTAETSYNIAKGCSATATHTAGSAALAFDGDLTTRWESDHGVDDVSLTVDLGALLPVERMEIDWEAAYARSYEVLVSEDGSTFTSARGEDGAPIAATDESIPTNSDGRRLTAFDFAEMSARYVRLHCTSRDTAYGYSIYEFRVFGKEGTVLPEEEYPVLLDAADRGSSDWAIEDEQWLLVDFRSPRTFDGMEISWSDWQTPLAYDLLAADEDTPEAWASATEIALSDGKTVVNGKTDSVTARYVKIALRERSFTSQGYLINQLTFRSNNAEISRNDFDVTASSARADHPAENAKGDYNTYWASAYGDDVDVLDFADFSDSNRKSGAFAAKKIDLGEVKKVGRVDLYWRGDDGGKGKYYDLQISADDENWTTAFRQTHGDRQVQKVYLYESARYLRIIDYQSTSEQSFMLEGIVVNSQYPEGGGEGKVDYDVTLEFPDRRTVQTKNGSYVTGGTDFPSSRLVAYLDDSLSGKPVPSNDWWQGLLVTDKGYNLFTYPLMSRFMSDGFWLTYPGDGYFSGSVPGNGSQTVDVDHQDVRVGYAGMGESEVRVTDWSDYTVSAVMTDNEYVDKLTVFLSEGALYSYFLYAEPEKATVWSDNLVAVYDLDGKSILGSQGDGYAGDCIILCVRAQSGYETGVRDGANGTNAAEYEERYYIVNAPEGTQFAREENNIAVVMKNGNYLSVGALSSKTTLIGQAGQAAPDFDRDEAKLMHDHAYAFVLGSTATYAFDGTTNEVKTDFRLQTMLMREGFPREAYAAYLPHQTEKSNAAFGKYEYDSVRGICKPFAGNALTTVDSFYGIVPTFTEPTDDGFSASVLYDELVMLYNGNGGDNAPEDSNLISGDPYWQGKNLHPMAMAALAADQIGATDLRDAFLEKIEYILTDWFTYDEAADASTGAYFYYDGEWGTLYYKNSEFGAGVNLADHYFTYGYYTLAAGVLSAYRPDFAKKYGDMIELLIRDYMNWERDDDMFPYMRNFDMFAGHGWAGGYADNNSGNNQESAGEALNSWVGAYLYATAVGNEDIREAAIYGFTTELNAIKHYWFDYFGDYPDFYPYGAAGQVYGGSNFFGTFFNGEPLYAYGIHLIPGEEYLTSYGLTEADRDGLEKLIENMRRDQGMWNVEEAHKKIYAWQHIFIPIVAIYDADEAIEWYEQTLAEQGNVGNNSEQFNVYWLIHGMKSMGVRTTEIRAENGASATVYKNNGKYTAVCWNPTAKPVRYTFRNNGGVVGSALVPACSLVTADPTKVTDSFAEYADSDSVAVADYAEAKGVSGTSSLTFGKGGSVKYLLSCGAREDYVKVVLGGTLTGAKLYIDGVQTALTKTSNGYESAPIVLTFKHTVEIRADGGALTSISLKTQTLKKADTSGATVTTNSENGNEHVIGRMMDGNEDTRWESKHGVDDVWVEIALTKAVTVYQLRIKWEAASAAEYKVYFATDDSKSWQEVAHVQSSSGARTDSVSPSEILPVKYILIQCLRRTTTYGYSIFELSLYNLA